MKIGQRKAENETLAVRGLGFVMPPPLLLKPLLRHMIQTVAKRHPDLFDRLGPYANRSYLIDPTDLPIVLHLTPRRISPRLEAFKRASAPECDAIIAGPLVKLIALVEAREDGDALFFSRELSFSGDTEAVLALRNAIDDAEINLAEEFEALFGPLQYPLNFIRRKVTAALRLGGPPSPVKGKSR